MRSTESVQILSSLSDSMKACPKCGKSMVVSHTADPICPGCMIEERLFESDDRFLSGLKIGHFEVKEKIARGGMGEVYLVRDTRLDRPVALKFLPLDLESDFQMQSRFLREAKTGARLNHPFICRIHEIGEFEEQTFICMEYVEGESLDSRIARGPVAVEETVRIAREIAEALSEAHDRGIVHRDLKPSNIMLTSSGHVKVMDFGLAKTLRYENHKEPSVVDDSITASHTVVGSVPYLSPEQACGEDIDARSDIFALGCVIYEMLTGRRAFQGESASEIMAGVIKGEPDWDSLPTGLSPAFVTLLRRCLRKNPKDRIRDIGDVRLGIEDALQLPAPANSQLRMWQRPLPIITAGLVLMALTGAAVWALIDGRNILPSTTPSRFTISLPDSHLLPSAKGSNLALSPDGQTLVYGATQDGIVQLFHRPIDQFDAVPLRNTEGGREPFFSPDGQWVGFLVDSALRKVALAGGPAQMLTELPGYSGHRGAVWTSEDLIVIGRSSGLALVPAAGGEPTAIVKPEVHGLPWYPQVIPGRGAILFTLSDPSRRTSELQILLPESGERWSVLPNAVAGRVLDTGHLVFVRSGALWAVPFDQERLEIAGTPVPVVEGVHVYGGGAVQYAVSENGTLVYIPGDVGGADKKTTLALVDRQGSMENLPLPVDVYSWPRFSPDGTRIAVLIDAEDGSNIFLYYLSNNRLRQLTFDGGQFPIWTPDGTQITFWAKEALWNISSDLSEEPELLSVTGKDFPIGIPLSWSPDGRVLLLSRSGAETGFSLVAQLTRPEDGGVEYGPVLVEQSYAQGWANFSADGQWIAFVTLETGVHEVYVQPYPPGTGAKRRITHGGGNHLVWSRNGRELFYINDGQLWSMAIQTEPTLDWQDPVALFEVPWVNLIPGRKYDVTPDGQQFVFVQPVEQSDDQPREIRVVLNWFEELNRLVPTDN